MEKEHAKKGNNVIKELAVTLTSFHNCKMYFLNKTILAEGHLPVLAAF